MLITRASRAALSASLRPRPPLPPHPRRAQAAMFQAIKGLFGASAEQGCGKCSVCDPEVLGRCKPAEPGSVTPHRHHVLVRLPAPAGAGAPAAGEGSWWPESVDSEPAVAAVTAAVKQQEERVGGKVKVTAFDSVGAAAPAAAAAEGAFDLLIFPVGLKLSGVPLEGVGEAAVAAIAQDTAAGAGQQERLTGTTLLVCCHGKRDSRCGVLGTQLAERLVALVEERGLGGEVRVLRTSHVGGHVYAGNVLVYGAGGACSGDWFGGVNADNAEDFLAALLAAKDPGSADPALRPLWRGHVGLSKEEQKALFEAHAGGVGDIEDLQ